MTDIETDLVKAAYRHIQVQKNLSVAMDEAHLQDVGFLRICSSAFAKAQPLVIGLSGVVVSFVDAGQ